MPNNADSSPYILFPLPEVPSPSSVDNALPPHLFERVQRQLLEADWGPESDRAFHSLTSRWTINVDYDDEVNNALLEIAKKQFNDPDLKHEFNYAARYQIHDGNIPYLWTHMDQNAGNHMIDMCVVKHKLDDWGVYVDGEFFSDKENSAICMSSGQQVHSRPPYPSDDPEAYIILVFSVFTKPSHWWRDLDGTDETFKKYIEKYRWDGDIRFTEYNGGTPAVFDGVPEQNKPCMAYGDGCLECYVAPIEVVKEAMARNLKIREDLENSND